MGFVGLRIATPRATFGEAMKISDTPPSDTRIFFDPKIMVQPGIAAPETWWPPSMPRNHDRSPTVSIQILDNSECFCLELLETQA